MYWKNAYGISRMNYDVGPTSNDDVGRRRMTTSARHHFYRAMHFSAKRGIAIACRLSVRLSVCLSVTLVNCDHMG